MTRRVLIGTVVGMLAVAGCNGRSARSQSALAREIVSLASKADCTHEQASLAALWDGYERLLLATLGDPDEAAQDADRALALVENVPSVHAEARAVSADSVVFVGGYQCTFAADGGRVTLLRRVDRTWRSVDRLDFPDGPGMPWLVASSRTRGRVVVAESSVGTKAEHSDLYLLDVAGGTIAVIEKRAGLLDLDRPGEASSVATIRWRERPRHWSVSADSPALPTFVANVNLDDDPPLTIVSETPWIEALERACDPSSKSGSDPVEAALPCGSEIRGSSTYPTAGVTEVEIGREVDLRCGDDDNFESFSADTRAIVTLRQDAPLWRVVAIRPMDVACAARGTRVPAPLAPLEPGVEVWSRLDHPWSMGGGDGLLYWSGDPNASGDEPTGGPVARLAHDGHVVSAADISVAGGRVYWVPLEGQAEIRAIDRNGTDQRVVSGETGVAAIAASPDDVLWTIRGDVESDSPSGKLRRLRQGRIETIASDLEAPLGLAVQGTTVLVATKAGLIRIDLDSGTRETVYEAISPIDVAASTDWVAWTEATGRVVVVRAGGAPEVVSSSGRPTDIVVNNDEIVWLDVGSGEARRWRVQDP